MSFNAKAFDTRFSGSGASLVLVTCEDRWQVYHRLQSLDIDCECSGYQPLRVAIKTPTEAIQLWSILRRFSQSHSALVDVLEQVWQSPAASR